MRLTVDHLVNRLEKANHHHCRPKHHSPISKVSPPTPRRQLDITHGRKNVRHGYRARCANQLEHCSQITRQQTQRHRTAHQGRAHDDVPLEVEVIVRPEVREHDLAADKGLKGEGGKHVEAKGETGDVDHGIIAREVVQDVAESLVAEGEETSERHDETGGHGDAGGVMSYAREVIDCWCAEGAVDQQGIMVTDKG